MAPYWWPDSTKPDGLPYVRRDGERNPESRLDSDDERFNAMERAVYALATAYRLSGDERYSQHAAALLRTWFVDPATRMNPNLRFAQAVPGVSEGRSFGIIETHNMTQLVDRLEADRLVERVSAPTDRRSVRAALTEEGWRRHAEGVRILEEMETRLFGHLQDSDKAALSREDLLDLAEEAVEQLFHTPDGQYPLTEILLCDAVDTLLFRRMGLPDFRQWQRTCQSDTQGRPVLETADTFGRSALAS
jgi:DNA-binding MarR family transcriptional regulator